MSKMTRVMKKPFISNELGEPFAQALNFSLDALVSPKGQKIKVTNPEQYHFEPVKLLECLVQIFLNMGELEEFRQNIVNDTRSYKDENFVKLINLITTRHKVWLGQEQVEQLQTLFVQLKEIKHQQNAEDELYDDAPDEFLDPIMSTFMHNPVLLPTSDKIMDLTVIKKHLMNDPTDPFNRKPLSIDMVKPVEELQAKIEAYKEGKKKN